jgi:hypothetical protein
MERCVYVELNANAVRECVYGAECNERRTIWSGVVM